MLATLMSRVNVNRQYVANENTCSASWVMLATPCTVVYAMKLESNYICKPPYLRPVSFVEAV